LLPAGALRWGVRRNNPWCSLRAGTSCGRSHRFAVNRYDQTLRGDRRSASQQVHKEATPRPRNSSLLFCLVFNPLVAIVRRFIIFFPSLTDCLFGYPFWGRTRRLPAIIATTERGHLPARSVAPHGVDSFGVIVREFCAKSRVIKVALRKEFAGHSGAYFFSTSLRRERDVARQGGGLLDMTFTASSAWPLA
jgi:hypothetical protein